MRVEINFHPLKYHIHVYKAIFVHTLNEGIVRKLQSVSLQQNHLPTAAPATILLLSVCRCLCCCITTIYQPLHIILLSRDHPPMAGSTAPHASTPSAKPDSRAIAFRISSPTLLPTVCRRSVSCAIYCACISRSAFTTSDSKFRADSRTAPAP